jgi:hypothetical protein
VTLLIVLRAHYLPPLRHQLQGWHLLSPERAYNPERLLRLLLLLLRQIARC